MEIKLLSNSMSEFEKPNSGFGIVRVINGEQVTIILTPQEVDGAYRFQEYIHDMQDLSSVLEDMVSEGKISEEKANGVLANRDLVKTILSEYEESKEDTDTVWYESMSSILWEYVSEE